MRAKAPASSANLGPGFDVLAVALALYTEVEVVPAEELTVVTEGCGVEFPADATHLAARIATEVAGTDKLAITVRSEIPVGRGLGSSAALAVAAAAAAGAEDPFAWGARSDGHPENAAAAAVGGLVAAASLASGPIARRLPLDPDLRFVALVPDHGLPTTEARAALPSRVSHDDACFNLGRMGVLLAGLADAAELVAEAGDDRLHQNARSSLFEEAPALLESLRSHGALTSFWSGAGTTLVGLARSAGADDLAWVARDLLAGVGVAGSVIVLEADLAGVVTE